MFNTKNFVPREIKYKVIWYKVQDRAQARPMKVTEVLNPFPNNNFFYLFQTEKGLQKTIFKLMNMAESSPNG